MSSHPDPLVHEDQHVLSSHSEDGLGEGRGVPDHVVPRPWVSLDQPSIVGQRQELIQNLEK